MLGLWPARAAYAGLPGSGALRTFISVQRCFGGAQRLQYNNTKAGCFGCDGYQKLVPSAIPRHAAGQHRRTLTTLWQKQGRLLTWEKANTKPRCLLVCPLPTTWLHKLYLLCISKGSHQPILWWLFLFFNSSLTLAIKFTLYTWWNVWLCSGNCTTMLQYFQQFSSLPGTIYCGKVNFDWEKTTPTLTRLALCPKGVDCGLSST